MSKKVTVEVAFAQRVNYRCEVEMTRKEYDEHCAKLDSLKGRELRRYEEDLFEEYFGSGNEGGEFEEPVLDGFCEKDVLP